MSHLPAPHASVRHDPEPLQVILQLCWSGGQLTPLRHEFAVVHATSQFQPSGQTTAPLQLVTAQSILQVWLPISQLVH